MKRRVVTLAAVVVLVTGLAWFIWPHQSPDLVRPNLSLKIVRQKVENGRQAVFFQVVGANARQMRLIDACRMAMHRHEGPPGAPFAVQDFWAREQKQTLARQVNPGKEFGILAPTNAPVWYLQVEVLVGYPWSFKRPEHMWKSWSANTEDGAPVREAMRVAWNQHRGYTYTLGSGPITNSGELAASTSTR